MSRSNYKYRVYNGKIIKDILKNSKIYLLVLLFTAGILIGSLFVSSSTGLSISNLNNIISAYVRAKTEQGILQNFIMSASVNMVLSVLSVFLGFSLIGYPFVAWLPFLKGMGVGAFSGYMYLNYKMTGLAYCVILIYPGAIVSALAYILSCCDSFEYSKNAYDKSIRAKGQFERDETRIFLFRQFIYILVCLCSSFIESLFSAVFSGLFNI
mgnify:CR=1 FL=1